MKTIVSAILLSIRKKLNDERVFLELSLIGSVLGLTAVAVGLNGYKQVVLNLFFLPVILGGFFLGRYRACIMAIFCVVAASLAIADNPGEFSGEQSLAMVSLATLLWGAVLCLAALVTGSLSDDRNSKVNELHASYVGVVEVLSKYLQSANPRLKDRAVRVAELCQDVARELQLGTQQVDDIRVAALMLDLGKIEVTTRLVTRAMDTLEQHAEPFEQHSFHGMDMVHSLGSVLRGAIPLLVHQGDDVFGEPFNQTAAALPEAPIGARIIRLAREYDLLTKGYTNEPMLDPESALAALRRDTIFRHDPSLCAALERAVLGSRTKAFQHVLAE